MKDNEIETAGLGNTEEFLADLKQALYLIKKTKQKVNIPQIERCLHNAAIELHWACWNFGEVDEYLPE
jgi:hypothetical protein